MAVFARSLPGVQTVREGMRALRRRPLAAIPLTLEGVVFGALIVFDLLPADAAVAPASAVFPFDVYFDLKQAVAYSSGWVVFGVTVAAAVFFRSAILAATARLSDHHGSFAVAFRNALRLSLRAALFLLPAAAMYFIAIATSYAPFIGLAALLGVMPALLFARRGASLSTGGASGSGAVPETAAFLLYAALLMGAGAAISVLSGRSAGLAALLVACLGPLHATVWLGWRERAYDGASSSEGRLVSLVYVMLAVGLLGTSLYDRNLRDFEIVPADRQGTLLLLGGADSSTRTGALVDLEPGALGFRPEQARLLSYRADGGPYRAGDTHADLDKVAPRIGAQIEEVDGPSVLLGHSQASLILDCLVRSGGSLPERSAVISPAPQVPPQLDVPEPGETGEGRVGGDLARGFSTLLDLVSMTPYDIDSPASPTNLDTLRVADPDRSRLALWALGDSILLDTDWRRRGETNLVVLTDHVGATRNPRALEAAGGWFQGKHVGSDDGSWRSVLVNVYRFAFEPWRP